MLQTYLATYATGWRATVRAETKAEARRRAAQTGRGERFTLAATAAAHSVFGNDADDDYEDGE